MKKLLFISGLLMSFLTSAQTSNGHASRYVFSPSGFGIEKDSAYLNVVGPLIDFQYGISDKVSVGIGTPLFLGVYGTASFIHKFQKRFISRQVYQRVFQLQVEERFFYLLRQEHMELLTIKSHWVLVTQVLTLMISNSTVRQSISVVTISQEVELVWFTKRGTYLRVKPQSFHQTLESIPIETKDTGTSVSLTSHKDTLRMNISSQDMTLIGMVYPILKILIWVVGRSTITIKLQEHFHIGND